jgi:hypothetical protein
MITTTKLENPTAINEFKGMQMPTFATIYLKREIDPISEMLCLG